MQYIVILVYGVGMVLSGVTLCSPSVTMAVTKYGNGVVSILAYSSWLHSNFSSLCIIDRCCGTDMYVMIGLHLTLDSCLAYLKTLILIFLLYHRVQDWIIY
jgi:hypothetical protein